MINPYLFKPFWVHCYLYWKHSRNSLCTPETQSPVISYRRLVDDYSMADKFYGRSIQGLWGHRGGTSRSEQVRGCSYRENWDVKEVATEEEKYQEENKSVRLRKSRRRFNVYNRCASPINMFLKNNTAIPSPNILLAKVPSFQKSRTSCTVNPYSQPWILQSTCYSICFIANPVIGPPLTHPSIHLTFWCVSTETVDISTCHP